MTTTEIEAPPPAPPEPKPAASAPPPRRKRTGVGNYITTASILVLGGYVVVPMGILLILSFNTATDILVDPPKWGLSNWTDTWQDPKILPALGNSVLIWFLVAVISFPVSIGISLLLARTQLPFARALELGFWVAFIFPPLASVIGWMMLASPDWGFANVAINAVFGLSGPGPLNIYSVPGIVWTRLMTDGIAFQVILLTPAFRNMNGALEEAGRVSGSSGIRTMFRVTLPVMVAPIAMVLALQVIKVFQGFEVEWLLGARWGFFVFSSLIYQMVSLEPVPQYAHAIVLASVTLLIIAAVIPIQNWIVNRRPYTTVTGSFKPGLINLRGWKWPTFGVLAGLLFTLTVLPAVVLTIGSFMARVGFFNTTPLWTLAHWQYVFGDPGFQEALRTTLILACAAGFICPFLFSILAYILVRTTWRGRTILDSIIWGSAALPGILLGLGLLLMFLITPGVKPAVRHHLATAVRGDPVGQDHRRQRIQGRAGAIGRRTGGGLPDVGGGLVPHLLQGRGAHPHADDGADRDDELRLGGEHGVQHRAAGLEGDQDPVDPGAGVRRRSGHAPGGGGHHQPAGAGADHGGRPSHSRFRPSPRRPTRPTDTGWCLTCP